MSPHHTIGNILPYRFIIDSVPYRKVSSCSIVPHTRNSTTNFASFRYYFIIVSSLYIICPRRITLKLVISISIFSQYNRIIRKLFTYFFQNINNFISFIIFPRYRSIVFINMGCKHQSIINIICILRHNEIILSSPICIMGGNRQIAIKIV